MNQRVRTGDIPSGVLELCRELEKAGFRAWIVGGCLRDLLRGKRAADWDLATTALPDQVMRVFPRVFPTGIQHGTVTVRHRGQNYEVTTLRGEGAYTDGRRPDSVEFVEDIQADLARRDFTVNALAYDPVTDHLVDPFGGLQDLDAGVIRAVGDARERFSEDGLRVLRAARFAASLEFQLDPDTEGAIHPTLDTFRKVSAERVREEWLKALKAHRPSRAFHIMERTGILAVTFPELAQLAPDSLGWAVRAVDAALPDPIVRLGALLAPLAGQPAPVEAWLLAYRYSNLERERILRMLSLTLPSGSRQWSDAEVRSYARQVGREWLDEVTALGEAVAQARDGELSESFRTAQALRARVRELVTPATPLLTKELAVGGRDLMQALGLKPGPVLGRLLDRLLEDVIVDPALNARESLLERARGYIDNP